MAERVTERERLLAELQRVQAEIDDAYWRFTRTARGQPPSVAVPHAYRRREALRAELRALWRRDGGERG